MKKVVALSFVAVGLMAMSCKKDYTCECTYDDGQGNTLTSTSEIKDAKKKDAEEACEQTATNGGSSYSCELK